MPVVIKNRFTQEVILVVEAESLKGAKLEGANLKDVDIGIEGYTLVKKNSICKQKFS